MTTESQLPDEQDDIARAILALADVSDGTTIPLTPDERKAISKSKAAAARSEFATDEEVRAVWIRYGR